jgi:uncharacterized membrane protein
MSGSGGLGYGGLWLMFLVGFLLVVLVGVAIYVALRAVDARPQAAGRTVEPRGPSPREVLDLRLAHGEISPEEYRSARPLLDS